MKDINKNNYNQAYSSCKNGSEMNLRKKKSLFFPCGVWTFIQ